MTITCYTRYEIDLFQKNQFAAYANNRASIIPPAGARHPAGAQAPGGFVALRQRVWNEISR